MLANMSHPGRIKTATYDALRAFSGVFSAGAFGSFGANSPGRALWDMPSLSVTCGSPSLPDGPPAGGAEPLLSCGAENIFRQCTVSGMHACLRPVQHSNEGRMLCSKVCKSLESEISHTGSCLLLASNKDIEAVSRLLTSLLSAEPDRSRSSLVGESCPCTSTH
jgi:hypothetical protein